MTESSPSYGLKKNEKLKRRKFSKNEPHDIISILSVRDIGKELLPYLKSKGVTNDREIAQIRKVAEAEMKKAMEGKAEWAAEAGIVMGPNGEEELVSLK